MLTVIIVGALFFVGFTTFAAGLITVGWFKLILGINT